MFAAQLENHKIRAESNPVSEEPMGDEQSNETGGFETRGLTMSSVFLSEAARLSPDAPVLEALGRWANPLDHRRRYPQPPSQLSGQGGYSSPRGPVRFIRCWCEAKLLSQASLELIAGPAMRL